MTRLMKEEQMGYLVLGFVLINKRPVNETLDIVPK